MIGQEKSGSRCGGRSFTPDKVWLVTDKSARIGRRGRVACYILDMYEPNHVTAQHTVTNRVRHQEGKGRRACHVPSLPKGHGFLFRMAIAIPVKPQGGLASRAAETGI